MSIKRPAHAKGTVNVASTPSVPAAPVKDYSGNARQLEADRQGRTKAILAGIAKTKPGADLVELAGCSPELADLGLTVTQARVAAKRFLQKQS